MFFRQNQLLCDRHLLSKKLQYSGQTYLSFYNELFLVRKRLYNLIFYLEQNRTDLVFLLHIEHYHQ